MYRSAMTQPALCIILSRQTVELMIFTNPTFTRNNLRTDSEEAGGRVSHFSIHTRQASSKHNPGYQTVAIRTSQFQPMKRCFRYNSVGGTSSIAPLMLNCSRTRQ